MEFYFKLWTIMCFVFVTMRTNAINIEDDDSSFGRCPWIKNQLRNGRVKIRSRGRIAKFICNPGFELAGRRFATCVRGRWNNPIPMCIARGCHKMPDPPNGNIQEQYRGALLKYDCHPGYILEGSRSIYCDGNRWSDFAPVCVVANTDPKMSCDFEDPDLCGWMHDPTNDFDWKRNQFSTPSGHVDTGPSYDHTFGKGKGGFYIYIEASLPRKLNDTSRLFSPVYPSGFSGGCFVFWYHMYGSSTGGLRIYFKPESHVFVELSPSWEKYGDQGNQWFKGNISVPEITENFQIIIEGVRGTSYMGDTAVDDVILRTTDCDQVDNSTEIVEESTSNSCRGRCREDSDSDSCGCTDSCISYDNCCDDFVKLCTPGNDTMIEEIPEETGAVSQTTDISNYLETTSSPLETSPQASLPIATTSYTPSTTITTTLTKDKSSLSASETTTTTPEEVPTLPPTTSSSPSAFSPTIAIPVAESTSITITTTFTTPTTISPSTTSSAETSKGMSQPAETSNVSEKSYSSSPPTSSSPTISTRKIYNLRPRSSTTSREEISSTSTTTMSETQKTYNLRPNSFTTNTIISTNPATTSSPLSTTSATTTTSKRLPPTFIKDTSLQTAPMPSTSTTQASIFTSPIEFRSTPTTSSTSSTITPQASSTPSTTTRSLPTITWIRRTTATTVTTTPRITTTNQPTSIYPRIYSTIGYKITEQTPTTRRTFITTTTDKMTTLRRTWPTRPSPRLGTLKYDTDFTRITEISTQYPLTPIMDGHSANHHHSPAPSPSLVENASKLAGIIVVTILFIVLAFGILYVIRRRRAPKQSKLADDSEMRFLSDNEIIEYSDPSVLERMPLT